eukprot:TRINITY_DN7025_c0_g1_i1.p1 TRINITY_DN7025_c0_g1~~TRINITY_DN7025_c0_g1_i1.p1  ORF type:complete len:373 (-),score=71.08 TRINITY_DN7025_c0_g1_i1:293-1411(-)
MDTRNTLSDDTSASILLEMFYSRRPEDLSYTSSPQSFAFTSSSSSPSPQSSSPISSPQEHEFEDGDVVENEDNASQKSARRTLYGNEWGTKNTASTYGHCLATTCMLCDRGCPTLLFKSPTWANIMRVVFYCLKYDYPNKPFFSLKNDVYQFMVEHWNKLCLNKKRSDNWHKQIQDMLSHSKNVFESGVNHFKQNGFWRLRQSTDPWTLDRETAIISKKASASAPSSPASPISQPSSSPKRSATEYEEDELFMSPKKAKMTPPSSPSAELAPQISSMAFGSNPSQTYVIPSLAPRTANFGKGKSPVSSLLNNDTPSIGLSVSLYNEDVLHQQLSAMASSLVNIQSELASGPSIQPYTIYHQPHSNRTTAIES